MFVFIFQADFTADCTFVFVPVIE